MSSVERPPRPDPPWKGVIYVAMPDKAWHLAGSFALRCRFGAGGAGRAPAGTAGRKACGRRAVAEEDRGTAGRPNPWAYCEEHMHARGHWIEFGEVWGWDLQRIVDPLVGEAP